MEENTNRKQLMQCRKYFVCLYILGIVIGTIMVMHYMRDVDYSSYKAFAKYNYVLSFNVIIASILGLFYCILQIFLHIYDKSFLFLIILLIVDCFFWKNDYMGFIQHASIAMLIINCILTDLVFYVLYFSVDNINYALYLLSDIQKYEKKYIVAINNLNNKIEKYNDTQDIIKELLNKYCTELSLKEKILKAFKGEGFNKEKIVVYNSDCKLSYEVYSLILLLGWGESYSIRKKYIDCRNKLIELTNNHSKFEGELDKRIDYYDGALRMKNNINKYGENDELKGEFENVLKVLLDDAKEYKYKKIHI